jgi:hypothetical protein
MPKQLSYSAFSFLRGPPKSGFLGSELCKLRDIGLRADVKTILFVWKLCAAELPDKKNLNLGI